MSLRHCPRCGKDKPAEAFGKRPPCKACRKEMESTPAYKAARAKRRRIRYATDEAYRRRMLARSHHHNPETERARKKRVRRERPEKHAAWRSVKKAILAGKLAAPSSLKCIGCGRPASEYHHHKGYAREHWRDVVPVCSTCHGAEHRKPI